MKFNLDAQRLDYSSLTCQTRIPYFKCYKETGADDEQ